MEDISHIKTYSIDVAIPLLKSLFIIGAAGSGKTKLAKNIAEYYSKDEVAWVYLRRYSKLDHPFLYNGCTEKTKLIIIDDFYQLDYIERFYLDVSNGVKVHQQYKYPFTIDAKIILVCDERITNELLPSSVSFSNRFDVVFA